MSYNKEYYEEHKEHMKAARDRYREANREEINKKQKERYRNMTEEEREKRNQILRDKRAEKGQKARIQYKIDYCKRQIKLFEEKMFMLKMVDTWDSSDYRYSDELHSKIMKYTNMIKELEELKNGTGIEK